MSARILAAGVGNVFLGDDGFGVEVAERLAAEPMPEGVHVADFGIRGVHLAYELLDGYEAVLLIDALPRGGEPGTLYVLEPDLDALEPLGPGAGDSTMDAHGMNPEAVFSLCKTLGSIPGRALVLGCEPADCSERMGLSGSVAAAVAPAAEKVRELLTEMAETARHTAELEL